MNHVSGGEIVNTEFFIFSLLLEIKMLGWPVKWIQKSLASIPKRHQSALVRFFRHMSTRIESLVREDSVILSIQKARGVFAASRSARAALLELYPDLERDLELDVEQPR